MSNSDNIRIILLTFSFMQVTTQFEENYLTIHDWTSLDLLFSNTKFKNTF